jgi:hypothetical protein
MSKKQAETNRTRRADATDEQSNLARQYGNIGISAVAAALPYAGNGKNSAYASTHEDDDRRSSDRRRSVLAV